MGRLIDESLLQEKLALIPMEERIFRRTVEELENAPTVEAIPKSDYENRLKADMVANYKDIQAEIRHFMYDVNPNSSESDYACNYMIDIIQQKIDKQKENKDEV